MFHDPRWRRLFILVASGTLILLGLAAGALEFPTVRSVLLSLAALIAGSEIAVRAANSLRNRHISIELLVTLATGGALLIGETWEAAAVTFLFIFGAYLEARTLSRTRQVLGDLLNLAPTTAIVLRSGRQVEVLPHEVEYGETVWVKPGARLPVDGEVVEGESAVDESAITGEPIPAEKSPGEPVYAGTLNSYGLLLVRATGVGADTTLARIIRRVEEAQDAKAPTQRLIERFARWYTPAIIALSSLVYLLTRDLELALTLLVIGCPGALVIATPVSVVAGIGRAARSGILIKGGEHLETAGKISAVAMDKTGTLTQGKPQVTDIIALAASPVNTALLAVGGPGDEQDFHTVPNIPGWDTQQSTVLFWAAVAEAGSEHPLARAILSAWDGETPIPQAGSFQAETGKGVSAEFAGRSILVGAPAFLQNKHISISSKANTELERLYAAGKTAILVAVDGVNLGVIGISDPLRPNTRKAIERLRQVGIKRLVMLTGDNSRTAQAIAAEAGIREVHAELLPEDKLIMVQAMQKEGHVVAMLGDGINDAPALAQADAGIAMGAAGSGIAIETAGIAILAGDIEKLPEAIDLSRRTLGNIHQNVVIALATVSLLLLGVLLGRVHMAGGMLIHEASVLVVILNGMRLLNVRQARR